AVVKNLRGTPTRTAKQKVDGYDTEEWVYEDARAPAGIRRLTVDFGLVTPAGYRPDLVRSLRLDPKPGAFSRDSIVTGWAAPAAFRVSRVAAVRKPRSGMWIHAGRLLAS